MGWFSSEEEDEDTEEEDVEYYDFTVSCDNCEAELELEIPKGTRVKDFLKQKKCTQCGCFLIEQTEEEDVYGNRGTTNE